MVANVTVRARSPSSVRDGTTAPALVRTATRRVTQGGLQEDNSPQWTRRTRSRARVSEGRTHSRASGCPGADGTPSLASGPRSGHSHAPGRGPVWIRPPRRSGLGHAPRWAEPTVRFDVSRRAGNSVSLVIDWRTWPVPQSQVPDSPSASCITGTGSFRWVCGPGCFGAAVSVPSGPPLPRMISPLPSAPGIAWPWRLAPAREGQRAGRSSKGRGRDRPGADFRGGTEAGGGWGLAAFRDPTAVGPGGAPGASRAAGVPENRALDSLLGPAAAVDGDGGTLGAQETHGPAGGRASWSRQRSRRCGSGHGTVRGGRPCARGCSLSLGEVLLPPDCAPGFAWAWEGPGRYPRPCQVLLPRSPRRVAGEARRVSASASGSWS